MITEQIITLRKQLKSKLESMQLCALRKRIVHLHRAGHALRL